jgi:hypothetical protein
MKKIIRLTESDLTRIVKRIINEEITYKCVKGDCKNGYGEEKSSYGNYYKGYFKNGQFNGIGKLTYGDGRTYEGDFKEDDEDGYGKITLPTGGFYSGQVLDGPDGYGKFTNKHGRVFKGKWETFAGDDFLMVPDAANKEYGHQSIRDLENVKKDESFDVSKCKLPESTFWVKSKTDKNYEYANGYGGYGHLEGEETPLNYGSCWWARNINTGKVFNISKIAKTNPKYQKSIDLLNKEFYGKYE